MIAPDVSLENKSVQKGSLPQLGDGRGLGIAIARGLASLHGGTLQEDPASGRLFIRMPAKPSVEQSPELPSGRSHHL